MRYSTKAVLILLLFVSTVGFSMIPSVNAAWLSGWDFRKTVSITGATGAGTDYQVMLNVTYWPEMQNDFDDIRFTDNDGSTLLDYWLESKVNSAFALFWVEVTDSLESNATLYMYYGNSGASSLSNGTETFLFFDDFNDNSLNGTKWFETHTDGSYSEAGGILTVTADPTGWEGIGAKYQYGSNHAFGMSAYTSDDNKDTASISVDDRSNDGAAAGGGIDSAEFTFNDVTKTRDQGVVETQAESITYTSWSRFEIITFGTSTGFFFNHALVNAHSTQVPLDDMGQLFILKLSQSIYVNWTYTRKCVSAYGLTYLIGDWTENNAMQFIFRINWDPAAQFGYDAFFIFLGLIMIPASTVYLVRGGKKEMSTDKIFYALILFFMGVGLVIGGIMP